MPPSPSPMLLRAPSAARGLVGRFLEIAPMLLHDGRSVQTPPPAAHVDWWVQCVDNELAGPSRPTGLTVTAGAGGTVGPLARDCAAQAGMTGPVEDWWADQVMVEMNSHQRPAADAGGVGHQELETPSARSLRLQSGVMADSPRQRAPERRREAGGSSSTPRQDEGLLCSSTTQASPNGGVVESSPGGRLCVPPVRTRSWWGWKISYASRCRLRSFAVRHGCAEPVHRLLLSP